jgi:hypothetical protein
VGYWELKLLDRKNYAIFRDNNFILNGEYELVGERLYLFKVVKEVNPNTGYNYPVRYNWTFDGTQLKLTLEGENESDVSFAFTLQPLTFKG